MYERASELVARLPNVSLVDIIHNDLQQGHFGSAVRYSAAFTKHVAISRKIGESLLERGVPARRICEIPTGVDLAVFAASQDRKNLREKFGASPSHVVLGFVGRLSGEKRPDKFLDVVAKLARIMPVQATMIGSGREEEQLRKRIESSDLPVVIRPKVERADLPAFYAALDFLIMTSTIEGMPLVALEALACGTPVASTRVGDIARIVTDGENGFLSPVDEVELLAEKIHEAIRDDRTAAMRAAAVESLATSGMTSSAMREGYVRLFSQFEENS
jgi:glycosyltransferase involved in cell wall biosynthesis